MTPETGTAMDPVGLTAFDLLHLAQNPKTPLEVLEKILEHPALSPEVVVALLRHPATPGAGMARLAERATGPLLDVLLGSLDQIGRASCRERV